MTLKFSLILVGIAFMIRLAFGLITVEDIRVLTNITDDCTKEIADTDIRLTLEPAFAQIHLSNDDDYEVEDIVASALRLLDAYLLEMLNVPIQAEDSTAYSVPSCSKIVEEYHMFVASTTIFLRTIDEKQQTFMWRGGSPVLPALSWLQALWASKNMNEQRRSFIEQQLELYHHTGCFGKSNEVLRRDVEIVEYMNNLIDSFT